MRDIQDIIGLKFNGWKLALFVILSILFAGLPLIVYLLLRFWNRELKVRLLYSYCGLEDAQYVVVSQDRKFTLCEVIQVKLPSSKKMPYLLKTIFENAEQESTLRIFSYGIERYILQKDEVIMLETLGCDETFGELLEHSNGWKTNEILLLEKIYGQNKLNIPGASLFNFFRKEILANYYVQFIGLAIWFFTKYEIYASIILILTIFTTIILTTIVRRMFGKLRKSWDSEIEFMVKRNDAFVKIKSGSLLPGDLVKLNTKHSGIHIPFDGILTAGYMITEECMLTGKSVPVLKNPVPADRLADNFNSKSDDAYAFYSGSKIIQVQPRQQDSNHVLAIVTATGCFTKKTTELHEMICPTKEMKPLFNQYHSYFKVMLIATICGLAYEISYQVKHKEAPQSIILSTIGLLTVFFAPSLPLSIIISKIYSIRRLQKFDICCTHPKFLNAPARVKMLIFDKTGTLTEPELTLQSIIPGNNLSVQYFSRPTFETRLCLGTCHSLSKDGNDLIGDPIDILGFNNSGFELIDPNDYRQSFTHQPLRVFKLNDTDSVYGVVNEIPFESQYRRMSVVIEKGKTGQMCVMCKGAPEEIKLHCDPKTIPVDYAASLIDITRSGYRVVALAGKELSPDLYESFEQLTRDLMESDLKFYGFMVLSNKLREEAVSVVREIQSGDTNISICTGDNLYTGCQVARETGIIPDYASLYVMKARFDANSQTVDISYEKEIDKNSPQKAKVSQDPIGKQNRFYGPKRNVHLAIDGETFRILMKYKTGIKDKVLITTSVFARFSPNQKMKLVEELKRLKFCVGMCGDGINDTQALKYADASFALSGNAAALASSFSSKVPDLRSVPILLKEGRATIEHSITIYRFFIMYGLVQFFSSAILLHYKCELQPYQRLYQDIVTVLIFILSFGFTRPSQRYASKRPPGNVAHPFYLYSLVLHVLISAAFVIASVEIIQEQKYYHTELQMKGNTKNLYVYETTIVFVAGCFQFFVYSIIFNIGGNYRKGMYTNMPMVLACYIAMSLMVVIIFMPSGTFPWLSMAEIKGQWLRYVIIAIAAGHLGLSFAVEYSYRSATPFQSLLERFYSRYTEEQNYQNLVYKMHKESWPEDSITN